MHQTPIEDDLPREVAAREWYHTVELAPGFTTPGFFDHRPLLAKLPIPASLSGKRCLDVGTFDGFWAFEMERRGASAVVGMDILDPLAWDWPADATSAVADAIGRRKEGGRGFVIASKALSSEVERIEASVYDLDPEIHGQFDFIFMGSLLLHLRDPIRALERVRSVCREAFLSMDAIDPFLTVLHPKRPIGLLEGTGRPWWWKPNLRGYERMVKSAGFSVIEGPTPLLIPPGDELRRKSVSFKALRHYEGRHEVLRRRLGDPHAFILAAP